MEVAADRSTGEVTDSARGSRRPLVVGILATALAATLVAGVFLGLDVARAREQTDQRAAAVHTARQLVVNFTTLDYRKFERDSGRVLDLAAGDFRKQYQNASANLKQLVTENKTVSDGEVLGAGVVSFDPDSARVLVVADSQVQNVGTKQPELRTYRLQLDLARVGSAGKWRVVELRFVG